MRFFLPFFLIWSLLGYSQEAKRQQAYLQDHHASWNLEFNKLHKAFSKAHYQQQVFLIGETHGIQYSSELQFALIRHLKEKTGFKYLLVELGYRDGVLLNRYLHSGKEEYLHLFFEAHQGTFNWNRGTETLYRRLYQLNQRLPEEERLIILPLDLEFAHREGIAWLQQEFFTPSQAEGSFQEALFAIDPHQEEGRALLLKYLLAYDRFVAEKAKWKQTLGEQFANAQYLLRNIYLRFQLQRQGSMEQQRDSIMAENLRYWMLHYGIQQEKMVGLFGSEHVKQVQRKDKPRLAAILKTTGQVQGVVSLYSVYYNCEIMLPNRIASEDTGSPVYFTRKLLNDGSMCERTSGLELLQHFQQPNKAFLFDLTARNSPFRHTAAFLKTSEQEYSTTDMFQILILINNSPATIPYGGISGRQ